MAIKIGSFWAWAALSVAFRLALIGFADVLNFGSRPEIATPLTSLRRLAEGYWLKQSSMSPYAGSMYHGSPLLLPLLGPLTAKRIGGQSNQVLACLLSMIADFITAMLIRAIGYRLQLAYSNSLTSGTGYANFYFATSIAYASLQVILLVEDVSSMVEHDGLLKGFSSSDVFHWGAGWYGLQYLGNF